MIHFAFSTFEDVRNSVILATQTHMRNNFGGGGGLKQTNKNKNSRSKPIGSVHFDELSLSTAPPNGNTQQLRMDYQLSDSSSDSSYSD